MGAPPQADARAQVARLGDATSPSDRHPQHAPLFSLAQPKGFSRPLCSPLVRSRVDVTFLAEMCTDLCQRFRESCFKAFGKAEGHFPADEGCAWGRHVTAAVGPRSRLPTTANSFMPRRQHRGADQHRTPPRWRVFEASEFILQLDDREPLERTRPSRTPRVCMSRTGRSSIDAYGKRRFKPPLRSRILLADVHQAVVEFDQGTGPAFDAGDPRPGIPSAVVRTTIVVSETSVMERCGRESASRADRHGAWAVVRATAVVSPTWRWRQPRRPPRHLRCGRRSTGHHRSKCALCQI